MVILLYFGPMGKLKFQFSLSVSTQFDLYSTKVGNMLKANDIWKKTRKARKTGVIHVILIFTELPCSSFQNRGRLAASAGRKHHVRVDVG